jgi:hypothetical protein
MFKTYISVAVAAALALSAGGALAANNKANFEVWNSDHTAILAAEDLSGLLTTNGQNFTMLSGTYVGQTYQNGGSTHPDVWTWNGSSWDWSSNQTATTLNLASIAGHGDPDLSFGIFVTNKSGATQTYNFNASGSISPVVTSAYAAYANLQTTTTTAATQKFYLSSDGGVNYVSAGVDISTSAAGSFIANASDYTNTTTFNYMRLVTTFSLTGTQTAPALVSSFASITPVPEPESYTMMLSGLALLAGMAFRRKF